MASLTLKYLRAGGVAYATQKMRDRLDHPVKVRVADDNPIEEDWNNYTEILWKFAIHYLARYACMHVCMCERMYVRMNALSHTICVNA